ncbi:MAG: serine/threonine protein phosphatase [Planctomycetaceae bacterium]|nr:serine/threonine protein phosphatase [Planctomycetaceae bacterium]
MSLQPDPRRPIGKRLLVFSDLHCDVKAAQSIVERAELVDVVIGAGDFGSLRRGLSRIIDVLRSIDQPCVLVPGNSESFGELQAACLGWESAHVLHGSGVTVEGVDYYGLGGGVPVTPFGDWSYDLTEEQAREKLRGCPRGAVLVSHSPPKGILDISSTGQSLGSLAVREAILEKKLAGVVCGHIHESAGQKMSLGSTQVVNAGPQGMSIYLG